MKVKVAQSLFATHGLGPARLLCPWNSPGRNTEVGSHSLLRGIFPTQGLNLGLLHCRQILYHLSHQRQAQITKPVSLRYLPRWRILSMEETLFCLVSSYVFGCATGWRKWNALHTKGMASLNRNPRGADSKARSRVWKVEGKCVFGSFLDEDLEM